MGRSSICRSGGNEDILRGPAFLQLSFTFDQNLNLVFVSPTLRG